MLLYIGLYVENEAALTKMHPDFVQLITIN